MDYRIGERAFAAGSRYLTLELTASDGLADDPAVLRQRLAEDGYLFLRAAHDPSDVLAASASSCGTPPWSTPPAGIA
jgi:hypothetical protein